MILRNRIAQFTVMTLLAFPALAADVSQWGNVQTLQRGDRVGIVQANKKRVEGRFLSSTGRDITIQSDRETTVLKADVIRVYRTGISRKKRALIGTVIGVAAGGVAAAVISNSSNNEGPFHSLNSAAVGATVVGGAAIGAGIGTLSGNGYQTIYQRAPNQPN